MLPIKINTYNLWLKFSKKQKQFSLLQVKSNNNPSIFYFSIFSCGKVYLNGAKFKIQSGESSGKNKKNLKKNRNFSKIYFDFRCNSNTVNYQIHETFIDYLYYFFLYTKLKVKIFWQVYLSCLRTFPIF